MPDLNSVAMTGTIAAEPKLIERGTLKVARLRLTVETVRRDRESGEMMPRQHHFNVAVFGGPAAEAARLRIGTHVSVRGQLSHSTFRDQSGCEQESLEVTTAEAVRPLGSLLDAPPEAGPGAPEEAPHSKPQRQGVSDPDVLDW